MPFNLSHPCRPLMMDRKFWRTVLLLGIMAAVAAPVLQAAAQEPGATTTDRPLNLAPPLPPWPDPVESLRYPGPNGTEVLFTSTSVPTSLLTETAAGWRSVCTTPCATRVDTRNQFGISGLRPSSPFTLPANQRVRLVASPVVLHQLLFYWSLPLVLGGSVFLGVGLYEGNHSSGVLFPVLGAVELAVGIPLMIFSLSRRLSRTKVKIDVL